MLRDMRTSIDFSDSVLKEAKRLSKEEGVPLKTLAEEGLRLAIEKRRSRGKRKPLSLVTFGSQEDCDTDLSWNHIRKHVYPVDNPYLPVSRGGGSLVRGSGFQPL
jgi:hypothetical protein